MRYLIALASLALITHSASAQDPFTNAKKAAQKAANAANAHVEAEQRPEAQKQAPKAAPAPKGQQPAPKSALVKPGTQLNVAKADTISVPTVIYRESFTYSADGRRDPFLSLLLTNELRPTLSDLKLSTIIYDPSSRRSIAVLRDQTNNAQYRVTTGSALGRMRVTAIHVLSVVFQIEEFGTSRMDSLVLRDTTNRRGR